MGTTDIENYFLMFILDDATDFEREAENDEMIKRLKNEAEKFFSNKVKLSFGRVHLFRRKIEITAEFADRKLSIAVDKPMIENDQYLANKFRSLAYKLAEEVFIKNKNL